MQLPNPSQNCSAVAALTVVAHVPVRAGTSKPTADVDAHNPGTGDPGTDSDDPAPPAEAHARKQVQVQVQVLVLALALSIAPPAEAHAHKEVQVLALSTAPPAEADTHYPVVLPSVESGRLREMDEKDKPVRIVQSWPLGRLPYSQSHM